jgi:hypothetical protein
MTKTTKRKPARKKPRSAAQKAATARMLKAAAAKRAGRKRSTKRATKRKVTRAVKKAAPVRQRIEQAAKLSRDFHGREPARVTRVAAPSTQVAMVLGALEGVIYRVPDGTRYLHEFRGTARPKLAATHDGSQLIVQGGRYRMTDRGIVDKRK